MVLRSLLYLPAAILTLSALTFAGGVKVFRLSSEPLIALGCLQTPVR